MTWRQREREWNAFALSTCVLALLTALWPGLDLWMAGWFYAQGGFPANDWALVQAVYRGVPWVGRGLALLALVLALAGSRGRNWLPGPWRRRVLVLGLAMLVGVGLAVNGLLKEAWGRARPVAIQAFGGDAQFSPALRPVVQCRTNCSFVSGHAATGFVLGAVGLLGAPATRRRWLWVGLAAGAGIGLVRMAQGGHFFSDVAGSALVVWGCNLALRAALIRWRLRRLRQRVAWA